MAPERLFHLHSPPCLLSALLFLSGLTLRLSYSSKQRTPDSTFHFQLLKSCFRAHCHRNTVLTRLICFMTVADSDGAFLPLPGKAKQGETPLGAGTILASCQGFLIS